MTKNFATRALMVLAILLSGVAVSNAQAVTAQTRRVVYGQEKLQPVASSAVVLAAPSMNLSTEQRAQISAISSDVVALHNERARLWSEYNALIARPDFTEEMSATQAAPRMVRIVAINSQLSNIISTQESQVAAILSTSQRTQAAQLVAQTKAAFAH